MEKLGAHDPGEIVIDEVAGQFLTLICNKFWYFSWFLNLIPKESAASYFLVLNLVSFATFIRSAPEKRTGKGRPGNLNTPSNKWAQLTNMVNR